jgi:hypothetical protein
LAEKNVTKGLIKTKEIVAEKEDFIYENKVLKS